MQESFVWRVLVSVAISATVILLLLFVWQALPVLLLIFIGILLGILLRWLRDRVNQYTGLSSALSLTVVLLVLLSLIGGGITLLAPVIENQAEILIESLVKSLSTMRAYMQQFGWGQDLLAETVDLETWLGIKEDDGSTLMTRMAGIFSTTFGAIFSLLLILLIGIYLAAEPSLYISGMLRLVPLARRYRAYQVMGRLAHVVRWWMLGQALSMLILGSLTTLGLWLLEIPLALTLGLIVAIMTFIPILGPIIAAVPTILIALAEDPTRAIYVAMFYLAIQNVEGYFITPMIHRRVIAMPPVLIISVQALLATLLGFMGVLLAMPLVACAMVVVQMLYVEDTLEDSFNRPALKFDECGDTEL